MAYSTHPSASPTAACLQFSHKGRLTFACGVTKCRGFASLLACGVTRYGEAEGFTTRLWRNLAKHKRVRAISITLDLGGQKSPIRKFNFTALCSETQGAEGDEGDYRTAE